MAGNRDLSKFANQLFVDSNGNIGLATNVNISIGHTNPSFKFDLLGDSRISGQLIVEQNATFNADVSFNSNIEQLGITSLTSDTIIVDDTLTASSVDVVNINATGISTLFEAVFTNNVEFLANIDGTTINSDNINVSVALSAASIVSDNIAGTTGSFDNINSNNLIVSGIATFSNDVDFSGDVVYTGVTTFTDGTIENLDAENINVSNQLYSNKTYSDTLYVNLNQKSYAGSLVGVSTNIISNTITTDVDLGYLVSGTNILPNTTVLSVGSSTITLSQNSTNNIISLQKSGIFESSNGNVIVGITTSGIVVGYGISNSNISVGTTITSIGINSVTISQNATNNYSKLTREGTLSSASTNIISGIDTTGIFLNQLVIGDFILAQTTVSQINLNEIVLSQNAFNTGIHTANYEIYFSDNFDIFSLEALTESTFTYTKPLSGIGSIYELSGNELTYNTGSIDDISGGTLSYTNGVINTLQSSNGTILNLDSNNIESTEATISNISGSNLNYTGIGTINTLGITSLTADYANINNIEIDSTSVTNLSGESFNFTGIGTVGEIKANSGTIGYFISTDISAENSNISGILTATSIYNTNLDTDTITANYSNIGVSTLTTVTISDLEVTGSMIVSIGNDSVSFGSGVIVAAGGTITSLEGTNLDYYTAIFNNLTSSSIASTTLSAEIGTIDNLNGTNLNYSGIGTIGEIDTNVGAIDYLSGIDLNYTGISTFNQVNAASLVLTNNISADSANLTNVTVDDASIDILSGTNINYTSGIITSILGTDLSYSGIGTIATLEGTNINYSGIGTIATLEGTTISYSGDASFGNVTVTTTITSDTTTSNNGTITNLSGDTISYNSGIVTSLTGTDLSYSGLGTVSNLEGTNINYSGIGTIATLEGTTISYSGDASFGSVTAAGATFTNDVSSYSIEAIEGSITDLNGDTVSYNSGIVTTLTGTDLSYSGLGTVSNLQGTNISYTGVGTFGQVGITTATIGTVNATNVSILGNLSVSDLTVGIVTANSVISNDITSNEGAITSLSGQNLNYSGVGTITSIDSANITSVNLNTQDITVSGIGTIPTIKSNIINNSQDIITDEIYSNVGIITGLSGDTIDYNSGSVDDLSGVNLDYTGIGTIASIDSTTITTTDISGDNASFTGISTFNKVGVTSLTSQSIFGSAGIITSLTGETLNYTESATISNVVIGGDTELVVTGDTRITGILTVGNSSVTISGINDSISGVSTITANVGNISTITGSDADYTNIGLESLTFAGINTSNNFNTEINIVASNSGLATSYNLILPAQLGIPGTVLTLESDGNLGFTTAGLYENRIYVSPVNGDDSNDGKARPVRTIKKAAQLASFESFVLPGGRYLDAANLLTANKDFIAAEVVGFVTNTYPGITTSVDYDEATCIRDVGYIVDAISYDLSYGGNSKSVEAGLAYWNAGTSYVDGESVETIAGFNHIITISKYIINNVGIPTSYQSPQTEFQTFDLTLAYDDQCNDSAYSENCCADVQSAIGSYVGIVTSIIGIGTTAAPEVTLPTSKSTPVAVIVEAGEYVEDNPIILYEDVSIIGDNLRNTIIRPANAGKDLFRVRNGCYLTGFALKDAVDPAGVPQYTFNYAVSYDDPADSTTSREGYAIKTTKPIITRSPYIQNCSILSFLGANGILVDGSKVDTLNTAIIPEESENPVEGPQPEFGKSMVAAAFTMVSFGGIGWRVINDGYSQVVSCFQIFCRYGSLAQSGGYLSITNSATNFGLYSLRSTGFNQRSYIFDRGIIAATGTSGGLQTLKVIGLGRADQELYVLRFINNSTGIDETSNFKLAPTIKEVDISVGVNTVTDTIGIQTHGFANGDSVIYLGNESTIPPQVIGGLVNLNEYYVEYINDDEFKLYEDDSLTRLVDLTSTATGINTFVKGNQEFFNSEMLNSHTSYQRISLASTTSTLNFVPGREITQVVNGGTAVGIAYTYDSTTRDLIVSVEAPGGIRNNFGVTGVGVNDLIQDHSGTPVSIAVTAVAGISTLHTVDFKVDSTQVGSQILGIGGLPENYKVHFHRPSIINSSSHTWEYSGSGTDYNALPQNGGKTRPETEQVFSQGGRVYSSGTNELGDFKIGNFITAFNRTGNIIFNNKVSIGQLDSLRLSLSGGVAIEEFSTDIGLGDNEVGGPLDSRVSTQKAVRTFLNNRLGNFIDKDLSTNAVPSAVVQLNAFGQINADLIPPKVVNYYSADVGGGRTTLVDRIPAVDLRQGDTVVEPDFSYVLISDVYSQYLILSDTNRDYNFNNGDEVVSAVSNGGAIGIVTAPTSVGYGTTGLVKGVLLNGNLTSGGSGYTNAGIYTGVTLTSTSGVGTDAKAIVTISSGSVTDVDIIYGGRYYDEGDTLTVINPADIGGRSGGSDFVFTVSNIETRLYIELTNNQKFTGSTLLNDYIKDGDATGISTSLTDTYAFTFDPTSIETGGDIDFTNDRIVIGPNNFSDGDNIVYSAEGGNTLEELISGDTYYIKRVGISSVELYTTYALSTKKNFLSSGTGTHSITRKVVNTSENKLTFVNHGYTTGDAVKVSGNVPGGITVGDYYFVGSVTTNSFSLHDTQQTALTSVNGLIFNAVDLTSVGSGTFTLTKQNVQYTSTINTSSNILDNWTVLSSGTVDAANITTGTISPSRLGSGTANSDTFLGGDSVYRKAVKSVGIGTTTPMTITSSSFEVDNGVTKHFGDLEISLNRVEETLETYSTTGVAKFKTSTFDVGDDGAVSIKNSQFGDVDAATLGGFTGAYYLDLNNATGTVSIPRGGTGLSALPSEGYLLVGNGSAYTLTGDPTIAGTLTGEITIKSGGDIELPTGTWTGEKAAKIQNSSNNLYLQYTTNLIGRNSAGTNRLTLNSGGDLTVGGTVTGTRLISNVANGTAPLTVTSSTLVNNLNADYVDGIQGASLLRSDANDDFSGTLTYTGTGTALNFTSTGEVILADHSSNSTSVPFDIRKSGSTLNDSESYGVLHLSRLNHNNAATSAGASLYFQLRDSGGTLREYAGISGQKTEAGAAGGRLQFYRYGRTSLGYWDSTGLYVGTDKVWTAGNDGSGSGLDADKLDDLDSSQFLRSDATDTVTDGSILQFATSAGNIRGYIQSTDTDDEHLIIATSGGEDIAFKDGGVDGATNFIIRGDGTLLQGTSNTIWHAGNDGPTSGLNADKLDDLEASQFLRSDTNTSTTGYLGAEGFVGTGGGSLRLSLPDGASYATTTASVTGAIKVTLPQSWTNTMMRMTIKVYEYATGESFEVVCGGYNHSGNSSWINTFGYIVNDTQVNRNFNIRFGHDGSKCCIYIGETSSTWSYPQVTVTEFEAGYSNYGEDTWNDGWTIGFSTTSFDSIQITSTLSNRQVGKYVDGNLVWHAGNDGHGSTLDADTVDTLQASQFLRSDENDTATGSISIERGYTSDTDFHLYLRQTTNAEGATIKFADDTNATQFGYFTYKHSDTLSNNAGNSFHFNSSETSTAVIIDQTAGNSGFYVGTNKVWHAGNDGPSSGLNADTVDGVEAASFLRSDENDSASGTYTFSGGGSDVSNTPTLNLTAGYISVSHDEVLLKFDEGQKMITSNDGQGNFNIRAGHDNDALHVNSASGNSGMSAITLDSDGQDGQIHLYVGPQRSAGSTANADWGLSIARGASGLTWKTGSATYGGSLATSYKVWHEGNDGPGSGLDADTIDTLQASQFLRSDTSTISTGGTLEIRGGTAVNEAQIKLDTTNAGSPQIGFGDERDNTGDNYWAIGADDTDVSYFKFAVKNSSGIPTINANTSAEVKFTIKHDGTLYAGSQNSGNTIWHAGNDGPTSGLNADKLDDLEASQFLRSDTNGTFGGNLTISGTTTFSNTSYRGDDIVSFFGASNDLGIFHHVNQGFKYANSNYIVSTGCDLNLEIADGQSIRIHGYGTNGTIAKFNDVGAAELYYDGTKKFETTTAGGTVSGTLTATKFTSTQATGTAPFTVSSTTVVSNLNADLWDGNQFSSYLNQSVKTNASPTFNNVYTNNTGRYGVGDDVYIMDCGSANTFRVTGQQNSDRGYIAFGNNNTQLGRIGTGALTWGGDTIWHAGNDGPSSGLNADTVDGYQASALVNDTHTSFSATNRPVGWYTIATNAGNRAVARFAIRDVAGSRHQSVVFYASHHYGNNSDITVLHSGRYSGNPFRYIRIREGGTYDGAMLQVYIDDATNNITAYLLGDNFQSGGWILKNWVANATNPGDLGNFGALTNTAAQIDINQIIDGGMVTTGEIYAGGKTSQSKVYHTGNLSPLTTSTTFGGDVSGTYNAIVVANDSHTHDGRYYTESESNTRYFRRNASNDVDVRLSSGNGRGLRFWDSNDYKIWMSSATDGTWGGRLDSTSDYNMYFRMNGGTNRGFVFQNGTTEVFQIESTGQVRTASNNIYANGNIVWHAGNDGLGSGLDADRLDGIDSTGFLQNYYETAINSPNATGGSWTIANSNSSWGDPKFNNVHDQNRYADGGSAYVQYNIPSGYKSCWISQLQWSSGGYADCYGVQSDGGLVFLKRINTRQTVENTNEGNPDQHDGSTITHVGSGLDHFTAIRIQNRLGRIHLTGIAWTKNDNAGYEGTGMVHPAQISHQGPDSGLHADLLDNHTWGTAGKTVRAAEFYADNWFRNYNDGEGLYNQATGVHWHSDGDGYWAARDSSNHIGIKLKTNGSTLRGYVYATNSNEIGFLDSDGNWAVRVVRDSYVELRDNNEVTFRAGQGGVDGDYGTVQTHGGGKGNWEGYSINGRYVFMSDDNETCGWYNDIDNRWIILYERNDYTDFYDPDGTGVWFRMDNGEMYSYIHNRFTDNDQVRLGSGADFRMWHNGSHHYFRNYNHGSGNIYWQGEDNEGTNHALLYMYTDGSRPYLRLYENGAERLRTTSTGVTVYGNLNSTSDERYKKNIERIENALNKIEQLEGITFDWDNDAFPEGDGQDDNAVSKPDFGKRSTGVIAQKVESVLPEAVTEDPETGMKNVAYGNMIGLLIEGIKEMNQKLSTIEDRLDKLEEKYDN